MKRSHVYQALPPAGTAMMPISFGELVDKITILEIKSVRIADPVKHSHVLAELEVSQAALVRFGALDSSASVTRAALKRINERLWDVEDDLRDKERAGEFGESFVELARSVYILNDERASLKRRLNEIAGSEIIEEKSFSSYRQNER